MLTKKKELYNRRRQRSEIDRILQKQRAFFAEGKTYEIRFRKAALKRRKSAGCTGMSKPIAKQNVSRSAWRISRQKDIWCRSHTASRL